MANRAELLRLGRERGIFWNDAGVEKFQKAVELGERKQAALHHAGFSGAYAQLRAPVAVVGEQLSPVPQGLPLPAASASLAALMPPAGSSAAAGAPRHAAVARAMGPVPPPALPHGTVGARAVKRKPGERGVAKKEVQATTLRRRAAMAKLYQDKKRQRLAAGAAAPAATAATPGPA